MRIHLVLFALIAFLCTVVSCTEDMETFENNISNNCSKLKIETLKRKVEALGFSSQDMIIAGNNIIVEGDIALPVDSVLAIRESRQYHTSLYPYTDQDITIGVESIGMLPYWASAITQVAEIYNEYTGLRLSFVGYDNDADIVLSIEYFASNSVLAHGTFPLSNSKPGREVVINSGFQQNISTTFSVGQKVHLLMHEIGHNLGLRHSNWSENGESVGEGAILIPGTPACDNYSYMYSYFDMSEWSGMSRYDAVTLLYMFPFCRKVHFANCDIDDWSFYYRGSSVYLPRFLYPCRDGYVFRGWQHSNVAYSPYRYDYGLTQDKTLYPLWKPQSNERNIVWTTYSGSSSTTFTLVESRVITFTSKVTRGFNTWYDLRTHRNTFSKLERIDGEYEYVDIIDMTHDGGMSFTDNPTYASRSRTYVLDAGTYRLTSSLTTDLGLQDSGSGNHGNVESRITYQE